MQKTFKKCQRNLEEDEELQFYKKNEISSGQELQKSLIFLEDFMEKKGGIPGSYFFHIPGFADAEDSLDTRKIMLILSSSRFNGRIMIRPIFSIILLHVRQKFPLTRKMSIEICSGLCDRSPSDFCQIIIESFHIISQNVIHLGRGNIR